MASAESYRYDLGNSQAIYLSNQGSLTTVTIVSSGMGQQQQSGQSFSSGQWAAPPKLYQLGGGHVAIVFAERTFYLSIAGGQMQVSSDAGGQGIEQQISKLQPLTMQPADLSSVPSMRPMTPMQPMTMTMGNMSMSMGEMRMGDMNLSTSTSQVQAEQVQASAGASDEPEGMGEKRFCSQCGAAVRMGDRFCSQCGHQLAL